MERAKRTKIELEAAIFDRCLQTGMKQIESVDVSPSETQGWQATYTAPRLLYVLYSPAFAEIVRNLRKKFDLAD